MVRRAGRSLAMRQACATTSGTRQGGVVGIGLKGLV